MSLDDATVEAIADELETWGLDLNDADTLAEKIAAFLTALPDPRPTEAEVLVSANDLRLALSPQPPSHWPAWDDWHAARDRLRNAAADREDRER